MWQLEKDYKQISKEFYYLGIILKFVDKVQYWLKVDGDGDHNVQALLRTCQAKLTEHLRRRELFEVVEKKHFTLIAYLCKRYGDRSKSEVVTVHVTKGHTGSEV